MKRWLLALLLIGLSAVLGHGVYRALCPRWDGERCTMEWLTTQLGLRAEQAVRIRAIHEKYWAELKQRDVNPTGGDAAARARVESACQATTQALIAAVAAELDASQRSKYMALVAPCCRENDARP
jgi:hypothetical protein